MSHYGVAPVLFESVSSVTATNSVDLGSRVDVAGASYVYVYNAGNSQISVGQGAVLSGVSGYSVTVSSNTGASAAALGDMFVGVCKHATLTTATYGWLMTRGFGSVKAHPSTGLAAGQLLVSGSDGVWAPATFGTNTGGLVQAKCTVATASAGVGEAYINCSFY